MGGSAGRGFRGGGGVLDHPLTTRTTSRGIRVPPKFCSGLSGEEHGEEVAEFYRRLGRLSWEQGFGLHEVLSAQTLLRRESWVFFDKVLYHMARGFEEH